MPIQPQQSSKTGATMQREEKGQTDMLNVDQICWMLNSFKCQWNQNFVLKILENKIRGKKKKELQPLKFSVRKIYGKCRENASWEIPVIFVIYVIYGVFMAICSFYCMLLDTFVDAREI